MTMAVSLSSSWDVAARQINRQAGGHELFIRPLREQTHHNTEHLTRVEYSCTNQGCQLSHSCNKAALVQTCYSKWEAEAEVWSTGRDGNKASSTSVIFCASGLAVHLEKSFPFKWGGESHSWRRLFLLSAPCVTQLCSSEFSKYLPGGAQEHI